MGNTSLQVYEENFHTSRSSRLEVFCKNGVLRNFAKFTGKHLRQSRFLNRVAGAKVAVAAWNFIKKEPLALVFSSEFWEISKNTFFLQNTSGGCFCTSSFMYFTLIFSGCTSITSSKEGLKVCVYNFFQRKVVLLAIYLFNHDSSKSTLFMLKMAFDVLLSAVFVKYNKLESFISCNIKLFALKANYSPSRWSKFSILTSESNSHFQQ